MARKLVLLACALNCAGILLAGLWPLRFRPDNEVAWREGERGLRFSGQGGVYSPTRAPADDGRQSLGREFSVILLLRPARDFQTGIAQVVTFFDPVTRTEPLLFGQWQTHLVVRSTAGAPKTGKRHREVGIDNAMQPGRTRCLAISCGPRELTTWVDGAPIRSVPLPDFASARQLSQCQLVLGCSSTGTRNWQGDIVGLAIFDHRLSGDQVRQLSQMWTAAESNGTAAADALSLYLFDEGAGAVVRDLKGRRDLVIPQTYPVLHKRILTGLRTDFRVNRSYLSDIVINIAGFVPFGICLALYRPGPGRSLKRTALLTLLGCLLSLGIELAQAQIPSRNSQWIDVIMNTIGTALGAFAGGLAVMRAVRCSPVRGPQVDPRNG